MTLIKWDKRVLELKKLTNHSQSVLVKFSVSMTGIIYFFDSTIKFASTLKRVLFLKSLEFNINFLQLPN